jgi:ABC-type transport system involved in multi-copper enzyme maturation permease subunit
MKQQLLAVVDLEWKKTFFNRRAWWIYLLAFGPVFLAAGHSMFQLRRGEWDCTLSEDYEIFAGIFQLFYLRLGIFFGCVGIFSNLFRGEILGRTLHYYFLTPVRRDVLLAGKYLGGVIAAIAIFLVSIATCYLAIGWHFGPDQREYLFAGPGLQHLVAYMGTAALACIGYGAVFLLTGLVFKNPMIPAAVIMGWEGINSFVPASVQKISVIHYLKSVCPVQLKLKGLEALIAVPSDPPPLWISVLGLALVSGLILVYAGTLARKLEINYAD